MKALKAIEDSYLPLVELFLPHRVEQAAEIGYQIELFKLDAEAGGGTLENLRLKEDGDAYSQSKYREKQRLNRGERVDDLYLILEGKDVYFGYNLCQ
jgi:hypothetical protein